MDESTLNNMRLLNILIVDFEAPNTSYIIDTKILSEPPNSYLMLMYLVDTFKELGISQNNVLLLSYAAPYMVKVVNYLLFSFLV